MKKLISYIILAVILNSCSASKPTNPSQNSALNSISKSSQKSEKGSMQNNLDKWLQEEWEPSVKKDTKTQEKYSDKSRDFKLQEYVDKASLYLKEHNSTDESSHSQKVQTLPVIWK